MNTPLRRYVAGVACAVLLTGAAACTSGPSKPSSRPSPSAPASTGASATMTSKPVPLTVRVTRVSGKLNVQERKALAANVGRAISGYFDAAYLSGDYPRSDFAHAFPTFTAGAARQAAHDETLLTNASLGPSTQSVTAKKQSAYLSVLAPYKVAAGVDAHVELVYVADRGDKPAKRVTVTGRLTLTRKKSGGWQIFGYHIARSATDETKGAS